MDKTERAKAVLTMNSSFVTDKAAADLLARTHETKHGAGKNNRSQKSVEINLYKHKLKNYSEMHVDRIHLA